MKGAIFFLSRLSFFSLPRRLKSRQDPTFGDFLRRKKAFFQHPTRRRCRGAVQPPPTPHDLAGCCDVCLKRRGYRGLGITVPCPSHTCRLIAPRRLFNSRKLTIVAQRANPKLAHTIVRFDAFQTHRSFRFRKLRQGHCFPQAFKVLKIVAVRERVGLKGTVHFMGVNYKN